MNILTKYNRTHGTVYYMGDIKSSEYKASSPYIGRATEFTDDEVKEFKARIN